MRRCISVLTLCAVLLFTLWAVPAFAQQQIIVTVDGTVLQFDVPPTIIDGRTLVPMRAIFEALGADVEWDPDLRTVTGRRGTDQIVLPIGSRSPMINGQTMAIDVPATIVNGRTMVPTRFIAESLGARVEWQSQTRTVSIFRQGGVPADEPLVSDPGPLKVVLLVSGSLEDDIFSQSAEQGMQMIRTKLGAQVSTIQMPDPSQWRSTLQRASQEDWDIIIAGTWLMKEHVENVAPLYPGKRYILFDTEVDYSLGGLNNVYSILYQDNEGGFLAGALAALVTKSDMPHANNEKIVGFIGGMDIDVIRNFLIGYLEGALYVDPETKVMVDFTDSFTDEEAGRERAEAQYSWGADIIFSAAGVAGIGQIETAKEWERYAIGVDYDLANTFEQSDAAKANLILTSVVKRIDNTLMQSVEKHLAGTLPYGQAEAWGISQEAMQLVDNAFYRRNVPSAVRSEMIRIADLIANGTIRVGNVYTISEGDLWQLVENVAP